MLTDTSLNLNHIIDILKREDSRCSLTYQKVEPPHEIGSWEFLSFARQDLEQDSERGRVNALGNAKRAIECRIDELLTLSNFRRFSSRQGWKLPYKMQVLQTFAVPAPDVLRNLITSKRNLLEHQYIRPKDQKEIENIADITELFLRATDPYVERGYIGSADIYFEGVFTTPAGTSFRPEKEVKAVIEETSSTERSILRKERYELTFDFENETITLTHREHEWERVWNLKTGVMREWPTSSETHETERVITKAGELREREIPLRQQGLRATIKEAVNTIAIRDSAMEDVRELMILLREKESEGL